MSMKTNKFLRIASVLLIAVLLSTCVISGTFAKYISTASGNDTARVAKWDITVEGEKLAVENTDIVFDLFSTVGDYDANPEDKADDADVINGTGENIIAPGTEGSFQFDIVNNSEVNAKYTIELEETNGAGIPLQYSVDGTTWKDSIAELAMEDLTNVDIAMTDGEDTQVVYWRWVFEGTTEGAHAGQTDGTDTALGLAGTDTVKIAASITVTQVD